MSQVHAEQHYMDNSRLFFREGLAPFGELNLQRIDHNSRGSSTEPRDLNWTLVHASPRILRQAWLASDWLPRVASEESMAAFEEHENHEIDTQLESVAIHANYFPNRQSAWFALRSPSGEDAKDGAIWGLGPYLKWRQVVGMAIAKHDVSGNVVQKLVKRILHPEKVYAAVSDINVMPEEQGKGLGTALLYTSLGMFRPDQKPTIYVPAANETLIGKLGELSYKNTGSHIREDLVPGTSLEEVRLQAQSVSVVRNRLVDRFPWLTSTMPIYR